MKHKVFLSVSCFLLVIISSCKQHEESPEEEITGDFSSHSVESQRVREIFYTMYKPEEMSRIFQKVGANFDPDLPHSPEHFARYRKPGEIAIAIGVYGVDLHYARMFDQEMLTARYFTVVEILSEKLGIPQTYYEDIFEKLEEKFPDRDSVSIIASKIYDKTDNFLKENKKNSLAARIVMGGWVEALYIATKILESNPYNMEIMERIGEQKYSLNSLIYLLSNYQEDIRITEYILMLKRLRKAYARYEIYYDEEGFKLDTTNKKITAQEYESEFDDEIVSEITMVIEEIRENILN
ncbi:MAG: hypothetical protein ACOCWA_03310 [Bacteroidota bacterium]